MFFFLFFNRPSVSTLKVFFVPLHYIFILWVMIMQSFNWLCEVDQNWSRVGGSSDIDRSSYSKKWTHIYRWNEDLIFHPKNDYRYLQGRNRGLGVGGAVDARATPPPPPPPSRVI